METRINTGFFAVKNSTYLFAGGQLLPNGKRKTFTKKQKEGGVKSRPQILICGKYRKVNRNYFLHIPL